MPVPPRRGFFTKNNSTDLSSQRYLAAKFPSFPSASWTCSPALHRLGPHSLASMSSVLANFLMLSLFLSCPCILCRLRRSLFQNDRYYTCSFFFCISGGSTFLLSRPFFERSICMNFSAVPTRRPQILLRLQIPRWFLVIRTLSLSVSGSSIRFLSLSDLDLFSCGSFLHAYSSILLNM